MADFNKEYRYELVEGWAKLPQDWPLKEVPGIYVNKEDRVFLMLRGSPPIVEMDLDGNNLGGWGMETFSRPHGMVSDEKYIYCTDDATHAVYIFNHQKQLIKTLGAPGRPSDTGCINKNYKTVQRSAGPFNHPTHVSLTSDGSLFVTDGYGNARVHKFSPTFELEYSWGEPGSEPGHFNLPHSIVIDDRDIVYVADRENNRMQLFTTKGDLLGIWEDLIRPIGLAIGPDGLIYVGEGKRTSQFDASPSRISIYTPEGKRLARLEDPAAPGEATLKTPGGSAPCYRSIHSISVDSHGDIYVTEVGQNQPAGYVGIKKYRRVFS